MNPNSKRLPCEREIDYICDRLLIMGKHPEWVDVGSSMSALKITKDEVLWVMHYMKNHDEWHELIAFGFGFAGEKDGSYVVRTYPEWLVGDYVWDGAQGLLYFNGIDISDLENHV